MGTANPMPANASWPSGSASATTMPTTRPRLSSSGPPELPGLTAASNWMSPVHLPLSVSAVRSSPEIDAGGHAVGQAERVADRDDGRPHVGASAEGGGHDDLGELAPG